MSPLTKLFVVLLVISSMLLAAATVVFVSKVAPLDQQLKDTSDQLRAARTQAVANMAAKTAAEQQNQQLQALRSADAQSNAAMVTKLQSDLNEAKVTAATLQAANTQLQSGLNTANGNVLLQSSTASKLQDQVTALRTSNDNLLKQNDEYSRRNAELASTVETVQARLKDTQEQLVESKQNYEKAIRFISDKGYPPSEVMNTDVPEGPGAPAIDGTVQDTSVINGNTFVTISVGKSEGVSKGMKFYVVSGDQYLGTVTVDTVDTDDAIGRLDGPRASQVQKGNEVKTQIRG